MKSKPILFSTEMVKAILDGRKTQTRRVVKPQPDEDGLARLRGRNVWHDTDGREYVCPYGIPGDLLWVRERHSLAERLCNSAVWYWADGNPNHGDWTRPRPSIHMPRWASRITLLVTDVRVERVQDITEDDARAEGVSPDFVGSQGTCPHKAAFADLWNGINANRGYGWDVNQWVWVVEFSVVEIKQ